MKTLTFRTKLFALIALVAFVLIGHLVDSAARGQQRPASPRIDFNREIKPILSDKCFACHGPDATVASLILNLDEAITKQ